ncbi:MAG: hypothetical protein ABEJ30_08470 [Halorientalis sp.]
MLVHSSAATFRDHGTPTFVGLLYAPNTDFLIQGGGAPDDPNYVGSMIVERANVNNNGPRIAVAFQEDMDLNFQIGFDPELTYLHVTRNSINVTAA